MGGVPPAGSCPRLGLGTQRNRGWQHSRVRSSGGGGRAEEHLGLRGPEEAPIPAWGSKEGFPEEVTFKQQQELVPWRRQGQARKPAACVQVRTGLDGLLTSKGQLWGKEGRRELWTRKAEKAEPGELLGSQYHFSLKSSFLCCKPVAP